MVLELGKLNWKYSLLRSERRQGLSLKTNVFELRELNSFVYHPKTYYW